ncbi:hypothetical protein C8R43DRAFT_50776 [Mycena crocata]|nr:hypothetical protein C8R43DRAFT_50776 [Mycena crocata]
MSQSGSMQTPAAVTTNFDYPTPPRLWRTSPHRRRLRSVPLRYRFQDTNFIPFSWSLCPPGFRPHMSEIWASASTIFSTLAFVSSAICRQLRHGQFFVSIGLHTTDFSHSHEFYLRANTSDFASLLAARGDTRSINAPRTDVYLGGLLTITAGSCADPPPSDVRFTTVYLYSRPVKSLPIGVFPASLPSILK